MKVDIRLSIVPWQKSKTGTSYYAVRTMVNGKRTYHYAGSGDAGQEAEHQQRQATQAKRDARSRELQLHQLLKRYEQLVRQTQQEIMLEQGWVLRRGGRWVRLSRCYQRKQSKTSL